MYTIWTKKKEAENRHIYIYEKKNIILNLCQLSTNTHNIFHNILGAYKDTPDYYNKMRKTGITS